MNIQKTIKYLVFVSVLSNPALAFSANDTVHYLPAVQNKADNKFLKLNGTHVKLKRVKNRKLNSKTIVYTKGTTNKHAFTAQSQSRFRNSIKLEKSSKRKNLLRGIKPMEGMFPHGAGKNIMSGRKFQNKGLDIKSKEQVAKDAFENVKDIANVLGQHHQESEQMYPKTGLGDMGNGNGLKELSEVTKKDDNRFSGMGFMPRPTAPQNNEGVIPSGSSGAPFIPPSPGDATDGIASNEDTNVSEAVDINPREDGTGARHVAVTRKNHTTGNVSIDSTEENPNGGFSSSETFISHDGSSSRRVTVYNSEGQIIDSFFQVITGPNRSQDFDNVDSDGRWARWWAKNGTGRRPDLRLKNPNDDTTDPGREGDSARSPSRVGLFLPEHQLLGDPSLSEAQQSRDGLDPETAHKMFRAENPNQVNPPSPNTLE